MSELSPRLKRYYTPTEVRDILGISLSKVYELMHNGDLPHIKVGGQYRIPIERFSKWEMEKTRWDPESATN